MKWERDVLEEAWGCWKWELGVDMTKIGYIYIWYFQRINKNVIFFLKQIYYQFKDMQEVFA